MMRARKIQSPGAWRLPASLRIFGSSSMFSGVRGRAVVSARSPPFPLGAPATRLCIPLLRNEALETVWKVAGGFLIACVSCFKSARWDIFALFWLLATLRIEAYSDFPDSLARHFGA